MLKRSSVSLWMSVGLTALFPAVWGQTPKHTAAKRPPAVIKKAASNAVKPLTVNDLAASPNAHLGHVSLVGVVATVNAGKGFLLIDSREYKECGLSCLSEAGTKKIPVRWTGATPKVTEAVRVDGILAKEPKGMAYTAQKVAKP